MDKPTIEQFKAIGSNSEAKKMFALEYFVRAMALYESEQELIPTTTKPAWAKGWVVRPAKADGICSATGCMNRHKAGDEVFIAFARSPRCLTCGEGA